jgi:hypothetical protein
MPYRLLLASAFIGPESEQNSSRLQTDCDWDRWRSSPNHRGGAQIDIDAAFQVLRSARQLWVDCVAKLFATVRRSNY